MHNLYITHTQLSQRGYFLSWIRLRFCSAERRGPCSRNCPLTQKCEINVLIMTIKKAQPESDPNERMLVSVSLSICGQVEQSSAAAPVLIILMTVHSSAHGHWFSPVFSRANHGPQTPRVVCDRDRCADVSQSHRSAPWLCCCTTTVAAQIKRKWLKETHL